MLTYCQWKQKELKMFIFYSVILFSSVFQNTTDGKPGMEVGEWDMLMKMFVQQVTNTFGD